MSHDFGLFIFLFFLIHFDYAKRANGQFNQLEALILMSYMSLQQGSHLKCFQHLIY